MRDSFRNPFKKDEEEERKKKKTLSCQNALALTHFTQQRRLRQSRKNIIGKRKRKKREALGKAQSIIVLLGRIRLKVFSALTTLHNTRQAHDRNVPTVANDLDKNGGGYRGWGKQGCMTLFLSFLFVFHFF